jgi:hypothetical protein
MKKNKKQNTEKKQAKKVMKLNIWFWIIFSVVAAIIIFSLIFFKSNVSISNSDNELNTLSSKKANCVSVQTPYEVQEEYIKTEYYTESVPYTDTECEDKNIAYSIDNFRIVAYNCNEEQDICTKYILGICSSKTTFCVDKTVSCSLDLRNLDNEERGTFTVKFSFIDQNSKNTIKTQNSAKLVYAQSTEDITGTGRIISEGVDGDANKQISCAYEPIDLPTKQVCKDIINYKDVQRERQVTAYRPITKYRTEQKCD